MVTFEQTLLIAIPFFSLLILLEYVYGLWRNKNTYSNISDAISSLLSGLTFIVTNTIGFGILVVTYHWLEGQISLTQQSTSDWWVWLLTFVAIDVASYWVHRWSHENGFLWSMHIIHHSSEHFNLPVALRQNTFKWISYRPLVMFPIAMLGVPVEVIALLAPIHYFMQYWYHTEHIGKLGWLEYVIMTPSQHRVHHAINEVYIDKNYAAIFAWDRLFGTYQEELDEEPVIYGCLGPVRTWDPLKIELRYIANMLRDAVYTRRWQDKIKVFTARTGWRPDDVAARWPGAYIDNPKQFERYQPTIPRWLEWWGFGELLFISSAALYLFASMDVIATNTWLLASYVGIILLCVTSLAALLEGRQGWFGAVAKLVIAILVISLTNSLYGLPTVITFAVLAYLIATLGVRAIRLKQYWSPNITGRT